VPPFPALREQALDRRTSASRKGECAFYFFVLQGKTVWTDCLAALCNLAEGLAAAALLPEPSVPTFARRIHTSFRPLDSLDSAPPSEAGVPGQFVPLPATAFVCLTFAVCRVIDGRTSPPARSATSREPRVSSSLRGPGVSHKCLPAHNRRTWRPNVRSAYLDGELCALKRDGIPVFSRLHPAMDGGQAARL
jgi:hypothetical protein